MRFSRERMSAAASDELLAATDVADLLVRLGVPFREAHGVVAGLVRTALDSDRTLSQLTPEELAEHSDVLAAHAAELLEVLAAELLARVEDLRGWHRDGPRAGADRAGSSRA